MFAASAYGQGEVTPGELSDVEKTAVGAILDSLGTKTGDELTIDVVREIDTVKAAGQSGVGVVIAVKMGAGLKLGLFQSVLVDLCVRGREKGYCRLAALPAPAPENDEIRTAATGADSGGGEAGAGYPSLGGGPKGNGGHNPGWLGSSSPTIYGVFNLGVNAVPQVYSRTKVRFLPRTFSIAVPAPEMGEGLPAVGVLLWLLRSWRSGKRGKPTRL